MTLCDRYGIKNKNKNRLTENYQVLLALRPNSGGQLVALSGLRLVSSEKEESISAWYLDKCLGLKERGTANVQNNTVAPTSKEGL